MTQVCWWFGTLAECHLVPRAGAETDGDVSKCLYRDCLDKVMVDNTEELLVMTFETFALLQTLRIKKVLCLGNSGPKRPSLDSIEKQVK